MINLSQLMIYCDAANSWMMCGRSNSLEHLEHVVEPLLRRYRRRSDYNLGGSCSSQAIAPSSVPIAQTQASSLPPGTFRHVRTIPHSNCSLDTLGSYHLDVPEISLCLQYHGGVWWPRLGRAKGDCAMCGGRRTSNQVKLEMGKNFLINTIND
jgi:hypothetical protein